MCSVLEPKKVKNVKRNSMGDKIGRIHMDKQKLDDLKSIKRMKALDV